MYTSVISALVSMYGVIQFLMFLTETENKTSTFSMYNSFSCPSCIENNLFSFEFGLVRELCVLDMTLI